MKGAGALVGLVVVAPACAFVFPDYPLADGGSGGADASVSTAASTQTTASSSTGEGEGGAPTCLQSVLAMDALFVNRRPDGSDNPLDPAWKYYGANIDGLDTGGDFGAHCKPIAGGNPYFVFGDGDQGIDNSFGKNLASLFGTLQSDINAFIANGANGYFIDVLDLGPGPDQSDLTTRLYAGAQTTTKPDFDGTFCWPVDGATVIDVSDVTTAKVVLTGGTLDDHVWTSGPPQTLELLFRFMGVQIPLTLHHAVIVLPLTDEHDASAPDTMGQISGILDTEAFVATASRYVASSTPSACPSFDSVARTIRQASDILLGGGQDPALDCNGISVGFGFTVRPMLLGGVTSASVTPAVPCADP